MKKYFIIVTTFLSATFLICLLFVLLNKFYFPDDQKIIDNDETVVAAVLTKEVREVLEKKLELITSDLTSNIVIQSALREANAKNERLTLDEKISLDERWRSIVGVDDYIRSFLTGPVSNELYIFQENNPGYPEIFVTDANGLNVGQTNKTTDYYQADEDWWVESYNNGEGWSHYGSIEYDESSQSESISLYVPVYATTTSKVIGVIKAVVDVVSIASEFSTIDSN